MGDLEVVKRLLAILPVAALVFAGCGSEDGGDDGAVEVDDAWARASAEGQTAGAVYFRITADEADRLLAASVPASVAAAAEVHEVVMADGSDDGDGGMDMDDDSDDGADPQMSMQELVDGLALPAGETVSFEPGGYHVMLLDLAAPLAAGDEIDLTLDLETADDITLTVEVAESAP
jgi:hypothetical protein